MRAALVLTALLALAARDVVPVAAATITVVNNDGNNEGFNDPTVVSPVGGNPGTTRGAQRLNAFTHAANLWAAQLTSAVTITVDATMDPLTCNVSGAVLGSAGTQTVHASFTNAPFTNTWYPQALANKIVGVDTAPSDNDIVAQFNSSIGTTCPFSRTWYYGLDGNPGGTQIDFVTVVLHEIGHGLGFQTFVDETNGTRFNDRDDVFMKFLEDHSTGKTWPNMTDAERFASGKDDGDLHWTGGNVAAASGILSAGRLGSHVQMYAPNPVESGSSVSHFDTECAPNELMEPSYTVDLTDPSLARDLLSDLGWDFATTTSTSTSTTSSTSTSSTSTSSTTSTSTTKPTTTSTSSTTSSSTSSSTTTSTSSSTTSSTSTSSTSTSSSTTTSTSSSTTSSTSTSTTSTSTSTSTTTTVPVACSGTPQTFQNAASTALTDNGLTTSTIVVSGLGNHLIDANLTAFLAHATSEDLDVTITSPSGTVVTLTTDNGGTNDNVFNGTTWDDDADPNGLVPYGTNNGLVTDQAYANNTVVASLAPEEALGAFIGENPNGTWTLRVSDDAAGGTGTLNGWSLALTALPQAIPTSTTSFTNSTPVTIIDTTPSVVTSQLTVSGVPTFLVDLDVYTLLSHTYSDDLDITLTSPAGTIVTLTTDNAPGTNNAFNGTLWNDGANPIGQVPYASNSGLVTDRNWGPSGPATPLAPEEPLAAFVGEDPNGVWTLTVSDDFDADGGTLSQWRLDVKTGACLATTTTTTTSSSTSSTSSSTSTSSTSSSSSTSTSSSSTTTSTTPASSSSSTTSSAPASTSTSSTSTSSTTSLPPTTTSTSLPPTTTSTATTTSVPSTTSTTGGSTTTTSSSSSTSTSSSTVPSSTSTSTTTTSTPSTSSTTTSSSTSTTTVAPTSTTSSTVTTTSSTTLPPVTTSTSTSTSTSTTTSPRQEASVCPSAPSSSCLVSASQRSVLVLRAGASPAKNLLKWKIARGGRSTAADLRDPVSGDAVVAVCVYDASGAAQPLLAGTVLPGGTCGAKPCWRAVGGGYRYKNRAATGDGVTDLKLRVAGGGEIQLVVKGKGAALPMPALGLVTPVRVQLVVGDAGVSSCWQSSFPNAIKNDAAVFKANGS